MNNMRKGEMMKYTLKSFNYTHAHTPTRIKINMNGFHEFAKVCNSGNCYYWRNVLGILTDRNTYAQNTWKGSFRLRQKTRFPDSLR